MKSVNNPKNTLSFFVLLLLTTLMAGCANRMATNVPSEYRDSVTEVESIGLAGEGVSAAFSAFIEHGYDVKELGSQADYLSAAKQKKIPFIALVDKVGTDGSWWDGFFDYSMRVIETETESIVWSASAEYGQGGVFINQVESTENAMSEMVENFSKTFPPAK